MKTFDLRTTHCPCGGEAEIFGGHVMQSLWSVLFGRCVRCVCVKSFNLERDDEYAANMGYEGQWDEALGLAVGVRDSADEDVVVPVVVIQGGKPT